MAIVEHEETRSLSADEIAQILPFQHPAQAIDMTADQMPAETVGQAQGPLQIHFGTSA